MWDEIPKGFRLKAQGCEARVTLGKQGEKGSNPNGVAATENRSDTTPLGLGQLWGGVPRVGAGRQPWALGPNPVGIPRWTLACVAPTALPPSRNAQTPEPGGRLRPPSQPLYRSTSTNREAKTKPCSQVFAQAIERRVLRYSRENHLVQTVNIQEGRSCLHPASQVQLR